MRYFTTVILALALLETACSHKAPVTTVTPRPPVIEVAAQPDPGLMSPTTTRNPGQPVWVDNADRDGAMTATGIAKMNPLQDINLQRTQATSRAIAALGRKLETKAESMYAEAASLTEATTGKKIAASAKSETLSVIRNLVSVRIKGVKIPSFWTDQQTGTLFALATLANDSSYEILDKALEDQPFLHASLKKMDDALAGNPTIPTPAE